MKLSTDPSRTASGIEERKRWNSHDDLLSDNTKARIADMTRNRVAKDNLELRQLVARQETYVAQLEEELSFCRKQLAETIGK